MRKLALPTQPPVKLNSEDDLYKKFNPLRTFYRIIKLMWKQTVPLFRRPLVKNTFLVSVLQFGIFSS